MINTKGNVAFILKDSAVSSFVSTYSYIQQSKLERLVAGVGRERSVGGGELRGGATFVCQIKRGDEKRKR